MRNVRILPYMAGSKSAKSLAESLGCLRLKTNNSRWKGGVGKTLINWGSSALPESLRAGTTVLNIPTHTKVATNKLMALNALKEGGVNVPDFTTSRAVATQWVREGVVVVCRTLLRANSGRGIVLASTEDEIVDAPLYTKYVRKLQEYRVHIMGDEVLFLQRKARNREVPDEEVDWQIRNHDNGFIFAHQDVEVSDNVISQAKLSVAVLNLDFGAVDVISGNYGDYVLEVNTACGLEGTTLEKYKEGFESLIRGMT